MVTPIKLSEIVDSLDMQSDESALYLDRRTGETIIISDEEMRAAEDATPLEEFPDWQRESITTAKEYLESPELFVLLPSKFDIDEWSIMSDFSLGFKSPLKEELREAISGKGAFQRFKHALGHLHLMERWYEYRGTQLKKIAKDWCESNNIAYIEDFETAEHQTKVFIYP